MDPSQKTEKKIPLHLPTPLLGHMLSNGGHQLDCVSVLSKQLNVTVSHYSKCKIAQWVPPV